jgi:hypothetical protein
LQVGQMIGRVKKIRQTMTPHLILSQPSSPLVPLSPSRGQDCSCSRGAASSGSTIFLESFFSRWPGRWAHARAHCTNPRGAPSVPPPAPPIRWWKATRRGSSEAAKLRAESQGCAARGAAARGQRGRGAAVRGRARPANLQQGGPTLAAAAPRQSSRAWRGAGRPPTAAR